MGLRLGVDVGGTFTDLLLIDEDSRATWRAKVASTPADPSVAVLNGIARVCEVAGRSPEAISHVMHGTTVATNAVLTGSGARVGLIVTRGYRHLLQIARSFVPGGLGAWVNYNKAPPLAPLALTIEADERIGADGSIVAPLDGPALEAALAPFAERGVDSVTVCFINAFVNDAHEREAADIVARALPGVPVSLSSHVVPEMQEYERAVTTVANAFVRPVVSRYIHNLSSELSRSSGRVKLHILRSDGGLAPAAAAEEVPVNLLMSGPAGGVRGALWVAGLAGYENLLTFDMGGTSTDVSLVRGGIAQTRRETTVGDVTVRASSVDVRSVGAGGGSIAHVPALTRALRVGPESAGADPGPAGYGKGGTLPTVTDANIVLGLLPEAVRLGGDMEIDRGRAAAAVQTIADALDFELERAAAGIYDIVNENMIGALRLVSVQQGYDPRDFALVAFGGAGPMHGNALARIVGSWPVIVPPGPGVLCAYGDATTRARDEASLSIVKRFSEIDDASIAATLSQLAERAAASLDADHVPRSQQSLHYEADVRYAGQVLTVPLTFDGAFFEAGGLAGLARQFDERHRQLYTFAMDLERELINLRAVVEGPETIVEAPRLESGGADPSAARIGAVRAYLDGVWQDGALFARERLAAGNVIDGPAIVIELDATTVVLPGHRAEIDRFGNIIIRPAGQSRH